MNAKRPSVTETPPSANYSGGQKGPSPLIRTFRGFPLLTTLILALPSLYFLTFVLPLWRDSDGFFQVASPLSYLTVLHWPPLYCFGARVPLLLGALLDGTALAHGFSFNRPTFTDLGIFCLLMIQHILLVCSLLLLCVALTERRWLRWTIALFFASNPALYAFANCVGSEALSNVAVLLVAATGLGFIRKPSAKGYRLLFAVLVLAILTRHVNAVLCALLPGTWLLLIGVRALSPLALESGAQLRNLDLGKLLRTLGLLTLVGVISIASASAIVWLICRIDKIPDVSRLGYTFQWRLNYLAKLRPQDREATLARISMTLNDATTTYALKRLDECMGLTQPCDPDVLSTALDERLRLDKTKGWKDKIAAADQRLNRLAAAFFLSGDRYFLQAIFDDFKASLTFAPDQICREPFAATDWLSARIGQSEFDSIRRLATFRQPGGRFVETWAQNSYLKSWRATPLWLLAVLTILAIVFGLLLARFRRNRPETLLLALALLVTGLLMCLANCALVSLAPRYTLSSYILFLAALCVSTVEVVEFLSGQNDSRGTQIADAVESE